MTEQRPTEQKPTTKTAKPAPRVIEPRETDQNPMRFVTDDDEPEICRSID